MGPQDGVDLALRAAAELARAGRDDIQFVFMGKETAPTSSSNWRSDSTHRDIVTFTGRVPDEVVAEVLSTADLGLSRIHSTP